ncbi:aldehyde ferredoxin oxidoreductase [Oceanispirochaeta crateris]|uniref:Aldehyde ferredoxin oxidoreductase n=1 Tax=Oceanispirochaeta crateris TaxID=2518645 RepID=A0A5C1QJF7_9SPIO|nr:aldehyde ferredoxin oxidoreductase [Oceanispirochaeta crateris]QEN06626.1 aldehyde ferredoxin oxidoreductase [Oceanispirochaeta crateris]
MALKGGWTGTILRVNLSTGEITRESTEKYTYFIGGMGIGYKVMWDEVPAGTHPFAEENRIIFGVGPLTGTGAMCSGRTNITSLLASNPFHGVSDSHMGGHFAVELKYAGYDAIIIQGKSEKPVWLRIADQDVSLEDASLLWGHGTFSTIKEVTALMGKDSQVAAIGQAGENQVNLSVIRTGTSHSAGGHGGVMGSKMLKAIGLRGTGSVKIAGDRLKWHALNKSTFDIVGANNQHVVPSTPQPWAEFHDPASRWTAQKGLMWGAAEYPIETGECPPGEPNKIGYRTMKSIKDLGPAAEKYTVRMGGCASCPVRCHAHLNVPELEAYGVSPYVANTCMGFYSPNGIMNGKYNIEGKTKDEATVIGRTAGAQVADDLGVWCNYGQIGRDFQWTLKHGYLKKVLPAEEYASLKLDLLEAGDPNFFHEFYRRIAFKEGELATLGEGAHYVAKKWNLPEEYWTYKGNKLWSKVGYPVHHSNESNGVVGAVISSMFNRDAQCHTHQNLIGSGLPTKIQQEIAAEHWGEGAIDEPAFYTPANEAKAKFTKWSIVRNVLHDSLTLCNWMWPMTVSPLKEKGYRGDTSLESKFFSMATGFNVREDVLDSYAERVFTLHRALTAKQMNSKNLREDHDQLTGWQYSMDPEKTAFDQGTIKLDKDDYNMALTYFYKEMGWDETTGIPTRKKLDELELSDVADQLESLGLLTA